MLLNFTVKYSMLRAKNTDLNDWLIRMPADRINNELNWDFEDGKRFNPEPRAIDKVRQRLIDTQKLICINENADEVWTEITGEVPNVVPGTKLTKSALYVPMIVGNVVLGYVSIQNLDKEISAREGMFYYVVCHFYLD